MKTENASNKEEEAPGEQGQREGRLFPEKPTSASLSIDSRRLIICAAIFFIAFGVRLLSWQDNRLEARKVQTAVTEGYKHTGRLIQQAGLTGFFSPSTPLNDPNHLGHPPGYSILIAVIFSLSNDVDTALQLFQILADSLAAVLIFLIALALLNTGAATISGLLVALAPQFTYNSVMLLPDTLSVVPVLLAVYLLLRAFKRPRLLTLFMSGALVGVSCWLRANTMLLAPFVLLIFPVLFKRGVRLRYGLALLCGSLIVILPLTIRNAIVYRHFIPVSLGAGQTFLEGIADYDERGTLGIPNTDMGLMKWEAARYNRPDYYGTLFNPDGVKRDRERIAYSLSVVRSHPFWFLGVMVQRGLSMFRLERVRLIFPDPPVTHSLAVPDGTPPAWYSSTQSLLTDWNSWSKWVSRSPTPDGSMLHLRGDESKKQLISPPITVQPQTDYVLKLPIRIEQGRMMIRIVGAEDDFEYASTIIEPQDWKPSTEQPLKLVEIPFVSGGGAMVKVVFDNAGQQGVSPLVQVGEVKLYALGDASYTWTRIPRFLARLLQKLFITAVMLPLALIGLLLLIRERRWSTIALLMVVPAYFISVQSALHTEYRYVLAIHYFLFIPAALALYQAAIYLLKYLKKIPFWRRAVHGRAS